MDGVLGLLGFGAVLGLGVAVPIGPVNAEIARRTLRGGFLSGFSVGAGATSVDVGWALVTSLALTQIQNLVNNPTVKLVLGLAGAILLAYFAVGCFIGASRATRTDAFGGDSPANQPSAGGGFLTGFLMNLLNPWVLMFWLVTVPGQVGSMHQNAAGAASLPVVCAGVALGAISWVTFFSAALSRVGLRHRQRWAIGADLVGGVSLAVFAVLGLWRTGRAFL